MCKCTPNIRTPFCGKPGCEWPEQRPSKESDTPKTDAAAWHTCVTPAEVVKAEFARAQEREIRKLESDIAFIRRRTGFHGEVPPEIKPVGALAWQIAQAQEEIESWSDSVRIAMGLSPRAAQPPEVVVHPADPRGMENSQTHPGTWNKP